MKTILFLSIFMIFSFQMKAQTDDFGLPSAEEKNQMLSAVDAYNAFFKSFQATMDKEAKKQLTMKFLKEKLSGGDVVTIWDVDSAVKNNVKFLWYVNQVPSNTEQSFDQNSIVFKSKKYDRWRKIFYAEVQLNKTYTEISYRPMMRYNKDTLGNILDSALVQDTLKSNKILPLTVYFKYTLENSKTGNFRFYGFMKQGETIALPPLKPAQQWWVKLPEDWKKELSALKKMDAYPEEWSIEAFRNREELNFNDKKFTDWSPLTYFVSLVKFEARNSGFNDFSVLRNCSELKYIDVTKSQITSLNSVHQLKKLEELYVAQNKLTTIDSLAKLNGLLNLNISECDIESLEPLRNMINLKELTCGLNLKLTKLDAISGLENLEKLSIRKIDVRDLSPLKKMKNLVVLDCYSTGITTLEPIAHLQKIYYLDLSNNKVKSLEPIRNFKFIVNLYLNTASVENIEVCNSFEYLKELDISNCPQIKSLEKINKLPYIKVLKCYFTGLSKGEVQRFKKDNPGCAITYY